MPKRNVRGGKGFKKGRKDGGVDRTLVTKFEGKDAGQLYGRVITVLGDRRFKCFCDDGKERICKLRGVLCWGPRRQRVEIGDIVLLSERSFEDKDNDTEGAGIVATASDNADISDIITKIPQHFWRDIRRAGGIHPDFFGGLSLIDPTAPKKKRDDDIFDGDDDSGGDSDTATNTIQHKHAPKWSADIVIDSDGVEDVDVDAI